MKKTIWTRVLLLALAMLLVGSMLTLGVSAVESDEEALGGIFSLERIKYAVSVTLQGMLMIFAVLALLWGVVAVFKVFLHDIPNKKAAKSKALAKAVAEVAAPVEQESEIAAAEADDGEIVAAITAAIAATLSSEEYKGQFASGFRVVSFSRKGGAWNKDN